MLKSRLVVLVALIAASLLTVAVGAEAASFTKSSLSGKYAFRLTGEKSFAAESGTSGLDGAPRQDILRVGTFTSGGGGAVTGHTLATTDDNNGYTVSINFTWTGSYTVNSDGTGTLTVSSVNLTSCTDDSGPITCDPSWEGAETYSIVLSAGNTTIDMVETDNNGGGAKIFLTGKAKKQ
jgi:hypothetical protein